MSLEKDVLKMNPMGFNIQIDSGYGREALA